MNVLFMEHNTIRNKASLTMIRWHVQILHHSASLQYEYLNYTDRLDAM